MLLQVLDVSFVVCHTFADDLDVVRECDILIIPPGLKHLRFLCLHRDFAFNPLQIFKILVLSAAVLHFDGVQLVLVFLRAFANSRGKLLGLLRVQSLAVLFVRFLSLNHSSYRLF
jgi:hypothetical protein